MTGVQTCALPISPGTEFDFLSSATRSWTILRCCRAIPLGSCGVVCKPATAAVLATAAINAICKDMCSLAFQWSSCRVSRVMTPANHLESCATGNITTFTKFLACLQSRGPAAPTTNKSRRQRATRPAQIGAALHSSSNAFRPALPGLSIKEKPIPSTRRHLTSHSKMSPVFSINRKTRLGTRS